jgi:uncharacterized protein involved in exopolysaccharide biosynthesis
MPVDMPNDSSVSSPDPTGPQRPEGGDSAWNSDATWRVLGLLYHWRRFVVATTLGMAVVSVVISLLLPLWYKASTRLLLPEGSAAGGMAAVLGDLAPEALALLGGSGGETNRYFSILTSRTVMSSVVERFDLETVYEVADSETPRLNALEMLADNTEFVIDEEFEFLSVEVFDRDPQRAADMANFFVAELNRVNSDLMSKNAANFRRFAERTLHETSTALDSARAKLQRFQEENGVIDLTAQTETFLATLSSLRAGVVEAEIRHEVLLRQLGPENASVRAAEDLVQAAREKYDEALQGSEDILPIAQTDVPEVAREYSELMQEVLIQTEILKFVRPLFEQARFDEQREKIAVQVLDLAVPPDRKAKPKRSVIVVMSTLSAFLLSILFVIIYDFVRRRHSVVLERLRRSIPE